MPQWNGKWSGGRTYRGKDGRTVYWLDRSRNGKRYGIALDVGSQREAEAELALFLRDPAGYEERHEAKRKAEEAKVILAPTLLDQFEEYLRKQAREHRHVRGCRHYLDWWVEQLGNTDLRKVELRDLRRCLKNVETAKRNRIAAYKVFCTFLREELAILPRSDDASLDLHAPPARPEKVVRDKGYSIERIETLYRGTSAWESKRPGWSLRTPDVQSVRDCLVLHAKTGLHQTEVERLARQEGTITEVEGQGEIAGTIYFLHKSGYEHTISVDLQTLRAAQRLQRRGSAPSDSYIRKVLDRTAKNLRVEPIRFG